MADTFLIVGLGNPGDEYAHTRHNAGFDTVDSLANELGVRYWKTEGGALVGKVSWHDFDLILAKPQSYMNTSGGPVKTLCSTYKVSPDHLVVIHDELDIDSGTIRVKFGGGHAGHNGLRSICDKLGTRDWFRVRCGIGRPPGKNAGCRLGFVASEEGSGAGFRPGSAACSSGNAVPSGKRLGKNAAEV